uniref:PsbP C-terminal domain-containing protein n=1 Tax=Lotharella oceanica TaxID=641309 RepID=A0A7S2U0K4_9EUKA
MALVVLGFSVGDSWRGEALLRSTRAQVPTVRCPRPVARRDAGRAMMGTALGVVMSTGIGVVPGTNGDSAHALSLPSLPALPEIGGEPENPSKTELKARDGTWEIVIPENFQKEDGSLINKFTGNHIEQYRFISDLKPKFSILVSEDPIPAGIELPPFEDVVEKAIAREKSKAYVDDVELLDATTTTKGGVDYNDMRYKVITARDEDLYFTISATNNNKLLHSVEIRVRNRDYEKFASAIDACIKSFKVMKT